MNAERARALLLTLNHTVEWTQWGDLIYSVGDKAVGGKMFAMVSVLAPNADRETELVISFLAGPERFHQLLETDGLIPAPYFARIHWVSAERWDALTNQQWEQELTAAHALTLARLPPKVLKILALPKTQQKKLIVEARALKAQKEAAEKKKKAARP